MSRFCHGSDMAWREDCRTYSGRVERGRGARKGVHGTEISPWPGITRPPLHLQGGRGALVLPPQGPSAELQTHPGKGRQGCGCRAAVTQGRRLVQDPGDLSRGPLSPAGNLGQPPHPS